MNLDKVLFQEQAREAIRKGVDLVADAVKVTLGPGGRNVLIDQGKYMAPSVTKDGVTVARHVSVSKGPEKLGAELLKQAATKTNDTAGDGTTTSTVLAQALVHEGLRQLSQGRNGIELKKGMVLAAKDAVETLQEFVYPINVNDFSSVAQVATISGNDEEVGNTVAEAYTKVGLLGMVGMQDSKSSDTTISYYEGLTYDKGFPSPYFASNPEKGELIMKGDVKILIYNGIVTSAKEMQAFLAKVTTTYGNEVNLLILGKVEGEALGTLFLNRVRQGFSFTTSDIPGYGPMQQAWIEDIVAVTGATPILHDGGTKFANIPMTALGTARDLKMGMDYTTLCAPSERSEEISAHVNNLHQKREEETAPLRKDSYDLRIAKLTSGIAVINVGAYTESDLEEKKYRYEDAISATRAALHGGIVPGGGLVLYKIQQVLKSKLNNLTGDVAVGYSTVVSCLTKPMEAIASNAGYNPEFVLTTLKAQKGKYGTRGRPSLQQKSTTTNIGFNARTGVFEDLIEAGVIDPAQVTREVINNATSVAGTILTTEAILYQDEEKS